MTSNRYHLELGATSTCTKILMEEMKGMGQIYLNGSTRDFFLFDSWFLSKKTEGAASSIGVDFIGMVKTNTKQSCKAMIEGLTKYWPGRSYIVLRSKPIVQRERRLLAIRYKYDA